MASSTSTLENREISQVTEIVSAHNRFRFSIEYLGINPNEYRTIESEAQFIHHDTLFECITRWKNRTEAEGNNAKDELIKILTQIRKEHGWFPYNDMAFLSDVMGIKIQESSKGLFTILLIGKRMFNHYLFSWVKIFINDLKRPQFINDRFFLS